MLAAMLTALRPVMYLCAMFIFVLYYHETPRAVKLDRGASREGRP
jgi:hypothetical protein